MESLFHNRNKEKVVVIMGATGTGKTKLAIDVAKHFQPAEVVNSDKMQVYEGLDISDPKQGHPIFTKGKQVKQQNNIK